MLFTDTLAVTTDDLAAVAGEVSEVADAESISLDTTIKQGLQEVAEKFLSLGVRIMGRTSPTFLPTEYGVQSLYTESAERPRWSLSQIVMTDADYPFIATSAKNYAVTHCLYNFYRNAARRKPDIDRYAYARDEWEKERRDYLVHLKRQGMPIVGRPMPRPAALWETGSGSWSAANVTAQTGGTLAAPASIDVAITYSDATYGGSNNESAPSDTITTSLTAGQKLLLDISSLKPPDGNYRAAAIAKLAISPLNATHWNIYANVTGSVLLLQATVPISQKTCVLDPGALATGKPIGTGQAADLYMTILDVILRG